ncbi:MAG: hypothetical protein ACRELZ_10125 [Candidatus Rokuibacteriota bacterium]
MAAARQWRVMLPNPPEWREIFLRLAAETPEGRALAPEFHGSMLTFQSRGRNRDELRLVKDLTIRTNFALEHRACGGLQTYVGDTRMSMTCSCGAEIVRKTGDR